MTTAAVLSLALIAAQAGPGYRGGMRFVGFLLIVLLVLAIAYLVKRISAK